MGNFSWFMADTERQIINTWCKVPKWMRFTVYMHAPDGRVFVEPDYGGYGEFGGKDYFELVAEINGLPNPDRDAGIELAYSERASKPGRMLWPILTEYEEYEGSFTKPNRIDPDQGDCFI
jgi:hypothetical protein